MSERRRELFFLSAKFLVFYTVLVIVWGAWVRISHSGDGCGTHWPLCQGALLPPSLEPKVFIEFTHRLMSGAYGIAVFMLFLAGRKMFSRGHPVRFALSATLLFTVIEALIGAKLVLFGLVGEDSSLGRVVVFGLHLLNTFFLLACTVFVWRGDMLERADFRAVPRRVYQGGILLLIIALTGAWASLSNTLYPSASLLEGMQQDLSGDQPILVQLRVIHPILAILGTLLLCGALYWIEKARFFLIILISQLLFGFLTLLSLSPIWMKLGHLLLADLVWVAYVTLVLSLAAQEDGGVGRSHRFT